MKNLKSLQGVQIDKIVIIYGKEEWKMFVMAH